MDCVSPPPFDDQPPGSSSFEGQGGESSFVDTIELQNEIAELRYQNHKHVSDIADLQKQVSQTEENLNGVTVQNERLERTLQQSKHHVDKLKEQHRKTKDKLGREVDEGKTSLQNCQELNMVLRKRVSQLDQDNLALCKMNDDLSAEIKTLKTDANTSRKQINELKEELCKQYYLVDQNHESLSLVIAQTKEKMENMEENIEKLTSENTVLQDQKVDLQRELVERKLSFDLGPMNGTVEVDDYTGHNPFLYFPPTPQNASLHYELTSAMGLPSNSRLPSRLQDLDDEDVFKSLQSESDRDMLDAVGCNCGLKSGALRVVLIDMWLTLQLAEAFMRNAKNGDCDGASVGDFSPELENGVFTPNDLETNQDEVVRRINNELAEFRLQLKQSQELFHALSNSSQNFGATQSCPRLTDPVAPASTKERSDCSTQTEYVDLKHGSPANYLHDHIAQNGDDEIAKIMGSMPIDGLEDNFRITPNLPTVLEECEFEVESSPRSSVRRMNSSDKGARPPLKRMPKAVTTDDVKSDFEDYQSAASSLPPSSYNSLDRPLSVSGARTRNGNLAQDDDTCSIVSEENTDFWSPIASPSSPTYWTPSQGSSSQETLTNHDGDRTPVNCDHVDKSFIDETEYSGSKSKTLSWGITMPIDNRHGISSIGVIPESQQEHMKRYAYDTVARSCDRDAEILSRTEWRTLKKDLDAKELANYKKCFGQEDGGETDDGGRKTSVNMDLDDEAEEHCEKYSPLVDELFNCLDVKGKGEEFSETDLPNISQRFEQLATVFKTDHMNLTSRSEATSKCYESALSRMKGISSSLNQCLQRIRDHKLPGEIHEDLRAMEHTSQELEMYSSILSRAARRAGRIDLETRLCKMIEVMVLYVHIMKTLHRNSEEELEETRKLLDEKGTQLPSKNSIEKLQHSNNNGNTVNWENGELDDNRMERFDDGKPKYVLQHLLGPKKSSAGLSGSNYQELVHAERHSSDNFVFRYVSGWPEIIQRELYWPWTWEQTWKGVKQGFSGIIMIVGLMVIAGSVIPNVGAEKYPRCESIWLRIFSNLANYGSMSHSEVPRM